MFRAITLLSLFASLALAPAQVCGQDFVRGDANGDGWANLDDSVYAASYLYDDGAAPPVAGGGDTNDNGEVELGDIVYLLEYMFVGGPWPSAPFPLPGPDPTPTPFAPPLEPAVVLSLPDLNVIPGAVGIEMTLSLTSTLPLNGLEVALSFDPAATVVEGWDVSNGILGIANAEYIQQEVSNAPGNAYAWLAAIVDFATPVDGHFLPAGSDLPVAVLTFSVPITASAPQVAHIAFADGVDAPLKRNLVVIDDGATRRPATEGGAVEIEVTFIRGDANHDCMLDISDAVYAVAWLFQGGPGFPCQDSADTNNDGLLDLADPIYHLNYLFQDGPSPSIPFPLPGLDPDQDSLDCAVQASCAGP
jgi:hypothetical protein